MAGFNVAVADFERKHIAFNFVGADEDAIKTVLAPLFADPGRVIAVVHGIGGTDTYFPSAQDRAAGRNLIATAIPIP